MLATMLATKRIRGVVVEDTVGRTHFSMGVSKVLVQSLTVLF